MWLGQLGSILQNYCYLIALNQSPHMQGSRPTSSCAKKGNSQPHLPRRRRQPHHLLHNNETITPYAREEANNLMCQGRKKFPPNAPTRRKHGSI